MSQELHDSLLLKTLRKERTHRRPVWLMRQAGRYLPEYLAVRKEVGSFLNLVKNPEAACEVTLQPIRRFGFDASIIFSDILIVPDAMDVGLCFVEGEGPRITKPVHDENAIGRLRVPATSSYEYLFNACRLTRDNLPADVPLIGFCGAPFTLACYMIDGRGGDFWQTRMMLRSRPDLMHQLLDKLCTATAELLIGQIQAGCQVAMIFDSWGGILPNNEYETFSLNYIKKVVARVKEETQAPVIVFSRQCALSWNKVANCGCDAIGVDWQTSLATAKTLTNGAIAMQGNLDPAVLLSDENTVIEQTRKTLQQLDGNDFHIFNLGHGIDKRTPPDNVTALVETVKGFLLPT